MSEQEVVTCETTEKSSEENNSLSRRDFLKLSAAVGTVAALSDFTLGGPIKTLVEGAKPQAATQEEDVWIPTACWMCGLGGECGLQVHRVNGVVVKGEGNPPHASNLGKICGRGQAFHMKLYNLYRVKAPVKRTNPQKGRGIDPQWVEISWDEALNTIAGKLKPLLNDPKKFVGVGGWASCAFGQAGGGATQNVLTAAFSGIADTGNPCWVSGPGGMTCAAGIHDMGYIQNGTSLLDGYDFPYTNYYLQVGTSWGGNKAGPSSIRSWQAARRRGMRMVVVDTRFSPEANKADEWIPIRGHTDMAFYLAIANVLLHELNVYDSDFIKNRTNGPYLIRLDNGLYVRSATEIMKPDPSRKNQALGKPLIWDPVDKTAKAFDDKAIKDFALEGGPYTIDGVACKSGFQLLKELVKQYTPEWAEKITTIPAGTIRRITSELAAAAQIGSTIVIDGFQFPLRPVTVDRGRGSQTHKQAMHIDHASLLPNFLLGAAEAPGTITSAVRQLAGPDGTNLPIGTASYRKPRKPDYTLYNTYWPVSYKSHFATWPALVNPQKFGLDYNLEAMCILGTNPVFGWGSGDVVTAAIAKVPFVFSISYHFDEPTELADIVLPDPGFTEELNYSGYGSIRQPLLDPPLFNTRTVEQTMIDLAAKAGFLPSLNAQLNSLLGLKGTYALDVNKQYAWVDILDRQLRSRFGDTHGLDWFKKNGVAPASTPSSPKQAYGYYWNPKTRYHLYLEYIQWAKQELRNDLKALGLTHPYTDWEDSYDPLPTYKANPSFTAPAEFDLFESNFRPFLMSMGFSPDNPWTMEAMAHFDPYTMNVWLNRATGEAKGLKDGDAVWVESASKEPWAKVKGNVKLSELVHPESCVIGGQWGRWAVGMNPVSKLGPHHNSLTSSVNPAYVDDFAGNVDMGAKVKIYKA